VTALDAVSVFDRLTCEAFLDREVIEFWLPESASRLSSKAAGEGEREMYCVEVAMGGISEFGNVGEGRELEW
jgi:hypothetical protein